MQSDWRWLGPYVSDRAWGTVREDYSENGDAWSYFTHDHARSRVYRWNEDGIGGICDRFQHVVMAPAFWNERDPILKERLFGVSGPEGNHAEDVKELYYYLDCLPTHSYMRMLYKYPQVEFPYADLVEENKRRSARESEYELVDALSAALAGGEYFDITIEYAKSGPDEIYGRILCENRSDRPRPLHVLPQCWFRNTWSWGDETAKPRLEATPSGSIRIAHESLGECWFDAVGTDDQGRPLSSRSLFTENETNRERLFGVPNEHPAVKDAFHRAIVEKQEGATHRERQGTKYAAHFQSMIASKGSIVIHTRFSRTQSERPFEHVSELFTTRVEEADAFYASVQPGELTADEAGVQRQAFGGLLWSKQYYHYDVKRWLDGDFTQPPPSQARLAGRNSDWQHVHNSDILSMPDKWEYPWYAAWDLAFHVVPLAIVDPDFAKRQVLLLLREWYQHPNGALPAYEWSFGDVNPPVHAWGAWQVYKISRQVTGEADLDFLERVFHKLLLNFTWWVNRKDRLGNNAFQGGFLGLDNIGIFDRSAALPTGGHLEQADGTAWMAMYCLNMLGIALELARHRPAYEDIATKFFEHFVYITNAFYDMRGRGVSLWDKEDGFYYDLLASPDGQHFPIRIRSIVGLVPLFAVGGLHPKLLDSLPHFRRRVEWFLENRPNLMARVGSLRELDASGHYQVAVANRQQLARILKRVFNESEFLSEFGIRSLSKEHREKPFEFGAGGRTYQVVYEPGESTDGLYGGNSNWRGPIWFPMNYLMIQALRKYHLNYGPDFKVEVPTGSGRWLTLSEAADEVSARLCNIFLRGKGGRRPVHGGVDLFDFDPRFKDHLVFPEYFHGETGRGLGATHQTGWTALVARLLQGPGVVGMQF